MKNNIFKYLLLGFIIICSSIILIFMIINDFIEKDGVIIENKEIIGEPGEELKEDISILIPNIKDGCNNDNCVTTNIMSKIYEYFNDNNYEKIEGYNNIYYRSTSNLIKLSFDKEMGSNTEEEQFKDNYDYLFNRYTTLDDLKKILSGQKINIFTGESATEIAVLNYHFFYDKKTEKCNQNICLDINEFEKQLKYLKNNNFKTLTIEEFRSWMYGEIELPKNSVLITIDDGAMGTGKLNGNKLIPLLEKYETNATLFLITAWWDPKNYVSKNLDVESHGFDIHKIGTCGSQNINCLDYNSLYDDLKKSFDIVGSYNSFCYPFYVHNSNAVNILSNLGVQVAFGGGGFNATRGSYRYYLPRYPIYSSITMDQFINMVN